jgi:hypothetical protein
MTHSKYHCTTGHIKVYKSHAKSSQAEFLYSSVFLVPVCSELTAHGSRYIAAEWTWTYSKHISRDHYTASVLARQSDLQKIQLPLLLRNIVTEFLPRIDLCGNLFINTLFSKGVHVTVFFFQ